MMYIYFNEVCIITQCIASRFAYFNTTRLLMYRLKIERNMGLDEHGGYTHLLSIQGLDLFLRCHHVFY